MSTPDNPEQQTTDDMPVVSAVSVDIYDQIYHLRGSDPEYIEALAASVDAKMRAVAEHGSTVDSLRVAVLAALNIADELARLPLSRSLNQSQTTMRTRAGSLSGMLDDILIEPTRRAG
jgi:cell division protein ZapA